MKIKQELFMISVYILTTATCTDDYKYDGVKKMPQEYISTVIRCHYIERDAYASKEGKDISSRIFTGLQYSDALATEAKLAIHRKSKHKRDKCTVKKLSPKTFENQSPLAFCKIVVTWFETEQRKNGAFAKMMRGSPTRFGCAVNFRRDKFQVVCLYSRICQRSTDQGCMKGNICEPPPRKK
ncbi:unnamed protein product [Cylicocyclus nassatus]|uniref:SCP domain-containing protein n=1 Tax=Cylicocyclus nassatus TaxID=53992 RepID=A0AA36M191_CYLNA|nr:unnamed protein product [Cylicocyclus nassatus]